MLLSVVGNNCCNSPLNLIEPPGLEAISSQAQALKYLDLLKPLNVSMPTAGPQTTRSFPVKSRNSESDFSTASPRQALDANHSHKVLVCLSVCLPLPLPSYHYRQSVLGWDVCVLLITIDAFSPQRLTANISYCIHGRHGKNEMLIKKKGTDQPI